MRSSIAKFVLMTLIPLAGLARPCTAQPPNQDAGPLRWSKISPTKLPSKKAPIPQPAKPEPAPTKTFAPLAPKTTATNEKTLGVGESLSGGRFIVPADEIKRTPFQYVGRLFNESEPNSFWGTGTILRGKKLLTARHLIEKLYERADNNKGDVILELRNGDRFRISDPEVTGVQGHNMVAQDLAVAHLEPMTLHDEPTLLGGADWQEFSNDEIGSRVYMTGYDMDVMPQDGFELIGRIGSTHSSTIYQASLRNIGQNVGEGIAEFGSEVGSNELLYSPENDNKSKKQKGKKVVSPYTGRWAAKSFLGSKTLNSALLGTLFGEFGASQAYHFDDCVWLSSDMICSTGANGAPIWLQTAKGRYFVVGVQSEPSGTVGDACSGTRIYSASSPDGQSGDSASALIKNFK